tara:strand:- start:9 stop:1169 length:1161 start_codon:yes stop_codon:yes gene_type:complete
MSTQNSQGAAMWKTLLQQKASTQVKWMVIVMIFIIITATIMYIYSKSTYKDTHCNIIKDVYTDMGKVSSINLNDPKFKGFLLRDFYIKTAYNCCAVGDFKNTFVDVCGLKNVIKQGVRVLDFAIYSVNNKPVIAVSSIPCDHTVDEPQCFLIKESYNYVEFDKAMQIVASYAYAGDTCPNPNDPLILNFRIMSKNSSIYDSMTETLKNKLGDHLLGKEYSYENNGKSLAFEPIFKFVNKAIIIVDKANPYFEGTKLEELVNIGSNSVFMRSLTESEVKYTPDFNELKQYNKKNITLELPDVSSNDKNPSAALGMKYGVQMIGMCYQNYDSNLEFYETFFANAGYAFVLKPEALRYVEVTIAEPVKQNPELSYAPRATKSSYYSFTV